MTRPTVGSLAEHVPAQHTAAAFAAENEPVVVVEAPGGLGTPALAEAAAEPVVADEPAALRPAVES